MKNLRLICLLCVLSSTLMGCASIVNDSSQPIKIEAQTAEGKLVEGAECVATNDYGNVNVKSGESAMVHRSSKDLDISCKHPDFPVAKGRAVSRANGGMLGNVIFGGGIGAIIDHNKGTAYTYPTWIQLVFGRVLSFDRSAEKAGEPVAPTETVATPAGAPVKAAQ